MKQIKELLQRIGRFIRYWLYEVPTDKPERIPPLKIKAVEIAHAYMVITYHGQRINMLKTQYPLWKAMGRYDKRKMAKKFEIMEREGKVRFEEIDGTLIAIKNRNYEK